VGTVKAVRALRQALSTFSRGGPQAMAAAGFGSGLAGFVEAAQARAAALRQAIEEGRFGLSYQPIVSLRDRSVHHYEALLRPRPARGLPAAAAADFVSMVEMVGLSERLDLAVLERAAEAARDAGRSVAFNLSALSVQNPAFRPALLRALDRQGGAREVRLLVEITETAELEDEAEAVTTVQALRARGIRVCIDDFGAGAAGFRVLRGLPVDFVKIDGSYVRHAAEDERDRAFVSAMIDLALGVRAEVIAEQIESEAVAAQMRALGAGYGQGWLFGRPVPGLPVRGRT
jgi:EAL domain-containing protein (putative c-di-GMP-specific phosphodiesterase class I)